jgi:hypothetical protein
MQGLERDRLLKYLRGLETVRIYFELLQHLSKVDNNQIPSTHCTHIHPDPFFKDFHHFIVLFRSSLTVHDYPNSIHVFEVLEDLRVYSGVRSKLIFLVEVFQFRSFLFQPLCRLPILLGVNL